MLRPFSASNFADMNLCVGSSAVSMYISLFKSMAYIFNETLISYYPLKAVINKNGRIICRKES